MKRSVTIAACVFVCFVLVTVAFVPVAEAASAGWSDDQRLTDNSTDDDEVVIDAEGDRIHLAWEHTVTAGSDYQVYYMNSSDGGWSWSNSQQISTSDLRAHNPDIGVNDTNIHIVWQDTKTDADEIFYRNSTDGGVSWNDERRLSEDEGNDSNDPCISVVNDELHVAWTDTRHSGAEVYYLRSLDGGITWGDGLGGNYGRRLTSTSGDSIVYDIVKDGNDIHIIYDDSTDGDGDVYYMVSYDNGVTWDSGVEIAGSSTDYAPAALAVNGSTVHVVWVEYDGSDYYIWYQNSTDNGGSWGSTQRLIGPVVMADDPSITCNSTFVSFIWEDGRDDGQFSNEIYIKNSTNSGGTWGVNTRLTDQSGDVDGPRITMTEGKKYVVWWDDRHGNEEIYFKCSPDFTSVPEFPNLLMPVLAVPAIIFLYERIRKTSKN